MLNKIIFSIITIICISSIEVKESFAISTQVNVVNALSNVQISGAVKKPGIYKIPNGARLVDVIYKAGGLKKDALVADVNMTSLIKDGSSIHIASKIDTPQKKVEIKVIEVPKIVTTHVNTTKVKKESKSKKRNKKQTIQNNKKNGFVNLNQATEEELNNLPGIGDKLARSILNYRHKNGKFRDVSELNKIEGIGDKKFNKLRNKVTI